MQLDAYAKYNDFLADMHNVDSAQAKEEDQARFAEI